MPSAPRPLFVAILIGLAAEMLFLCGVATPHMLVFDEVHYVPAARALLAMQAPLNTEHPLLAKEFIAAGIALFGDNAFGWRFFSTVAGAATVTGVFAILWLLFRRVRPAVLGATFAVLNFTIYVEARIAMLDGFLAAFTVMAVAAMLWAMDAPPARVWLRWILSGVLFGLAVASKWLALPYLALAGLAFLIVRWRDTRVAKRPLSAVFSGKDQPHWSGLPAIPALAVFGLAVATAYFLTFLPAFFYRDDPMTLAKLIPFQATMFAQQTQVLPHHTYQSDWWTWPLMIRPIWYLYERADDAMRGILMLGNPAILWGGLVAVLACLWAGWRGRSGRLVAAGSLWVAAYLPWVIIPKSLGFFYYYYVPSIALAVALAAAGDYYARGKLKYWDEGFLVICFGLAVYFFPILSAAPLANERAFEHWMWFSTWP